MSKHFIGVNSTARTHETSEVDPNDKWGRASTQTDWTINGIKVSLEDEYGLLPLEIEAGKTAYVVYAIWSTGDPFGHDENYGCETMAVFDSREKAEQEVRRLKGINDHSVPWIGYFEDLTEINIASGVV